MQNIGFRIRSLRNEQKRTLQEIADVCGFTKSLLSKIENGKTVPPVATLMKISDAFGVKISVLLEENESMGAVVIPRSEVDESQFVKTDKGYSFFAFAIGRRNKLMQPFLFIAEKGKVKPHGLSHAGEEFIYILEGEMKYKVGNTDYYLSEGDSMYFNSMEEHGLAPITDRVKYLACFMEPSK